MKIGILTHPLDINYGCNLQAFALQKVLRDMGHDVITIDRHNKQSYKSFIWHCRIYARRLIDFYVYHKDVSVFWNPFMSEDVYKQISKNTQCFIDRNIKHTRKIWAEQLGEIDEEYKFDAYVVGSDQVWLPHFCPNSFLNFVKRENVISLFYAASSGEHSFAEFQQLADECKKLSNKFSGISVREDSLLEISSKYLGRNAELVLDPTMLLNPNEYLESVEKCEENSPIIFCYFLDNNLTKQLVLSKIKEYLSLPVIYGNSKRTYVKKFNINIKDCIFPSIDDWINNLNRAKFVVTDSFHGTVMSIVFNKPFVVIGNEHRGIGRFLSLLKLFGLESRLICSANDITEMFYEPLNYQEIKTLLDKKKNDSINFLRNHLS